MDAVKSRRERGGGSERGGGGEGGRERERCGEGGVGEGWKRAWFDSAGWLLGDLFNIVLKSLIFVSVDEN